MEDGTQDITSVKQVEVDNATVSEGDATMDSVSDESIHKRKLRGRLNTSDKLVPPLNFAMVSKGVYRSGYPNKKNFPFLKRLGLRSIVSLSAELYRPDNIAFAEANGIALHSFPIQNHEPFNVVKTEVLISVLRIVTNTENLPVLVHCNKGNHSTGCIVGCLRKIQRWSLTAILDEYRRFTALNVRLLDQQVIELFTPESLEQDDQDDSVDGDE